ncbi:MAG TPA: L,D-transpeptidase family protein, partial [Pyrinomonadaceae bacterium]|nr:L,D-transpeptidase family protein [Pyrinomonadaceae bacterium]
CLSLVACEPATQPVINTNGANIASQPSPAASPAASPASESSMSSTPITLPVLDAMFSDETFANDLKSQLGLSDEQIEKLKSISRDAVLKLTDDSGDSSRSTRSAVTNAEKQIAAVIGSEKTQQLRQLVSKRWSGGDMEQITATPNSVPTDTRIVINSPAYRMDIFRDGQLIKSYKVGIGYPEFPLPAGLRHASEIIINPSWTPPDEPWVKGQFAPGKKVEAGSKLNPLGPIKIPIGLPSLIHGGKDPSRLGTFASHGCVGLTSPQVEDFAVQLAAISDTPLTLDDVKGYEKQKGETKKVPLEQKVPVELRYETIVAEDGKITIYRDVYERGTNTEDNLRKVLDTFGVSFDSLSPADQTKLRDALDQMAVDALGSPVDTEDSNQNAGNSAKKNPKGKITRNIKGKKEISIPLAALKGKGYPAPMY